MSCLRNQDGMALLLVLVIVALLSALLTEFSFSTLVDLRATETFRDRTRSYYLARGGVEAARMILQEDGNEFDHPSEFWGDPLANVPAGEGDVSISIKDLSGRLNLNEVADNRGNPAFLGNYHRFIALCGEVLGTDEVDSQQLADALVNWFNADKTQVTEDDSYYSEQNPPYRRKGGKLDTVDELHLLRYFSEEIVEQLRPYVRVFGENQINVNTASAEVLYAWQYSDADENKEIIFDRQDVAALVEYRQHSAYRELKDMALAEGIGDRWSGAWLFDSISVKGNLYQLESRGRVYQGLRVATAIVQKQGNQLLSLKVE